MPRITREHCTALATAAAALAAPAYVAEYPADCCGPDALLRVARLDRTVAVYRRAQRRAEATANRTYQTVNAEVDRSEPSLTRNPRRRAAYAALAIYCAIGTATAPDLAAAQAAAQAAYHNAGRALHTLDRDTSKLAALATRYAHILDA